jgi:hypothetical protein
LEYATCGGLLVEPQNHPSQFTCFVEFGPHNPLVWFQRESEAAHDIITKGASRQSNFVKTVWR